MIRVLIVEDSPVVAEFLTYLLGSDPEIRVVGIAASGEEGIQMAVAKKPDVITMDIHLPNMNGFEATRKIMETAPAPIVIVSGSFDPQEVATTFLAIEAGAIAVVPKPRGTSLPDAGGTAAELLRTVKTMSEVKVVKRWPRKKDPKAGIAPPLLPQPKPELIRIVAIGSSTGGPTVVQSILSLLHKSFPAPVAIVQHMAAGFIQGCSEWLSNTTGFPVHMASHGELLLPGHAYLAPDSFHMIVTSDSRILLNQEEPVNGVRPSVSLLFRSVAETCGQSAVGVLLTGMGKDGAAELRLMKEKGAVTIVQDKDSSIVYGMPGEAMRLDAATYVLSPERIAVVLKSLVNYERSATISYRPERGAV